MKRVALSLALVAASGAYVWSQSGRSATEDLLVSALPGDDAPVADIADRDVLERAERDLGIRTVYALADGARRGEYHGIIDMRLIRAAIPDYRERIFYISGPQAMVRGLRGTLMRMGVRRSRIRTDFFPGFA